MTEPMPPMPVGEDDLAAWVDRRLTPARLPVVEAYLASHPELASRLERYREQGAALSDALRPKLEEPIPSRHRVGPMLTRRRHRLSSALARAAAVLLIVSGSAAAGWFAHRPATPDKLRNAAANAEAAYATFTVDVRHPVEVRAEDGAHLAQWLSNRLERPLRPPDLAPIGWRLMGGRLLPTSGAPAALLMYDDDHGTRLTVYVQPMGIDGEEFHYSRHGDVGTVLWAERHLALAVTGHMSRDMLLQAAQSVRAQTDRDGAP